MHFSKFMLILTCGIAAWGQGFSAVWDENGNTLISTRNWPAGQTGTAQSRLYQTTAFGLQLVAAGAATAGTPDSIVFPRISARGETIAYSVKPFTLILHNPPPAPQYRGVVRKGGVSHEYAGIAGLSANGRWAVFSPSNLGGVDGTVWRDLATGQEKFVAGLTADMRSVADDGSVMTFVQPAGVLNSVRIYRPDGTFLQRHLPATPRAGVISRDGSTALLLTSDDPSSATGTLSVMEVASGVVHLINDQCHDCSQHTISDDGSQLLYRDGLAPATPHWLDWRSGKRRDLVTQAGPLAALQFSASGKEVYLADNNAGSYLQDLATGEETVLMPPVPGLLSPPSLVAPGGWYRIDGLNLSDVELSINGRVLPANSRTDAGQVLQIPWDVPLGQGAWMFKGAKSPFEPVRWPVAVLPHAPRFLRLVDLGETSPDWQPVYVALSETDGALINRNRPAYPGEVLRLWMTGVGRTPADLRWFVTQADRADRTTPIEALSVDPFPAQEGWWVARVRVPAGLTPGNFSILCDAPPERPAGDVAVLPFDIH